MAPRANDTARPVLVVPGGSPGSGKTTVARGVAQALQAVHVRVDAVEQAGVR